MEVGWEVSKCLDGKTFTVTGLRVRGSGLPKVWTRSSSSPGRTARRLDDLSRNQFPNQFVSMACGVAVPY